MSFWCDHCGEQHDTVDEARECAAASPSVDGASGASRNKHGCSSKKPTGKQMRYVQSLAERQLWKLKPVETCCSLHMSQTIEMLEKRRVSHGWDRRSRGGTKRNRQGFS